MASWNKKFLLEFNRIYKETECLWKVKSDSYHDKQKREKSYQRLLSKVREQNPDAQKDVIIKKKLRISALSFAKRTNKLRIPCVQVLALIPCIRRDCGIIKSLSS